MYRTGVVVLLALVLWVSGVAAQEGEQPFLLTFIPNIQFSPVYVALEKGYFSEAGMNFKVEYWNEPDVANAVADNRVQFGVVSGEQVILARSAQRPIVFVYEWFQKFAVGIVTPVDSGIETIADLKGRKLGIPGRFGASYSGMVALLAANDLTEMDVQVETIGFTAPDTVCVGYDTRYAQGVPAAVVYINNEPLQIEQRCTAVNVFPVSDYADIVANGLITNEATIANDPDLVRAVVGAFDRALADAINNPAEAYLLSAKYVESLPLDDNLREALEAAAQAQAAFLAANPDREAVAASREQLWEMLAASFDADLLVEFRVLLNTILLWDADQIGYSDPDSWVTTQENLLLMQFLDAPLDDLDAAYSNEFLPDAG